MLIPVEIPPLPLSVTRHGLKIRVGRAVFDRVQFDSAGTTRWSATLELDRRVTEIERRLILRQVEARWDAAQGAALSLPNVA